MPNITKFDFTDNQVRVLIIAGNPWFVASDLFKILELDNTSLRRLKEYEKGKDTIPTLGGKQEMAVISESGLYRLILTSRKPQAEPFQDWVCQEVLPQIRKTGKYEAQPKVNIYAHRVQLASQWNIPKGHWCVFHEISLLANKVGIEYPVAEYDLIDGSVGIGWNKYRKCFSWKQETIDFPLFFGDKRDLAHPTAKAYKNSELIYFREWLENIYTYARLPRYLDRKYGKLLNPQLSLNLDNLLS